MAAHDWQKSSYSADAANCIYLAAAAGGAIRIRESDDPDIILTTAPENLRALICAAKAGEFDHLTA
ncbi:DUF397 domain-containing protein [Kitasatospora sp. NPDC059146]|uniref:DUF397 domain-containing protein n=1 Tax=unclassified Kitasatospora TaxID=2633591 RepID=UPI0035DBD335